MSQGSCSLMDSMRSSKSIVIDLPPSNYRFAPAYHSFGTSNTSCPPQLQTHPADYAQSALAKCDPRRFLKPPKPQDDPVPAQIHHGGGTLLRYPQAAEDEVNHPLISDKRASPASSSNHWLAQSFQLHFPVKVLDREHRHVDT